MTELNWKCPYCEHPQTVVDKKSDLSARKIYVGDTAWGTLAYFVHAIGCSNPVCKKATVEFTYGVGEFDTLGNTTGITRNIDTVRFPLSSAKTHPEYVPKSIVDDYNEACAIIHLSPKASATLSRRCIQGMIRNFCGIKENTLFAEINKLSSLAENDKLPRGVTPESIEAIDALRKIGNIGAHMERDINIIIDVDSDEASTLVELIEVLIEDWYVARHKRTERFAKVTQIAADKSDAKQT